MNRILDRVQNEGRRLESPESSKTTQRCHQGSSSHEKVNSSSFQHESAHEGEIGSCRSYDKSTRPRNSNRPPRRPVPNLLAGSPLLRGPTTPHFAPSYPPTYLNQYQSQQGNMAIFPTFMLAPSIVAEGSEEFVRQAMQNAIGLPPILYQYAESEEPESSTVVPPKKSKKKSRQKCDWRKGSSEQVIPPRIDSTFDFPLLDESAIDSAFVSSPRMIETPVSGCLDKTSLKK